MTKPDPGATAPSSGPDVRGAGHERAGGRSDGLRHGDRPQPNGGRHSFRSSEHATKRDAPKTDRAVNAGDAAPNQCAPDAASDASKPASDDPFAKKPSKRGRRRRRGRGGRGKSAGAKPEQSLENAAITGQRTAPPAGNADAHNRYKTEQTASRRNRPDSRKGYANQPNGDRLSNQKPGPKAPAIRRPHKAQTAYAALDLGTNNCRLLVAVPTRPGMFRVVDAFSRIVRLGEGLGASGRLSDDAMDRAVEALAVCRDKLTARPIERTRLIATEACRAAENGASFLDRVQEETGLTLEVVDRETEARLAVSGCGSLVDRTARSTILFDIGGGSSEIAILDLDRHRPRNLSDNIVAWTSLPVGVVTMAERFGGRHVDEQSFAAMVDYAEELLAGFAETRPFAGHEVDDAFHLIGTSGTVTTLAGIHLGLERYDRRRVDGLWMRDHEVDRINDQLLSWSFDERVANPCIGRDRADLVLAGCAILQAIRKVWPARRLRVADRGLREGILTEMMAADGVWRRSRYRRGRAGGSRS